MTRVKPHRYQRDPQSGAGNCTCGGQYEHRLHPHPFRPAGVNPDVCVCALPLPADCHLATDVDPSAFEGDQ